jgi:hypothetical protein
MSKMGNYVFQMQEDAVEMTEEQFYKTYGLMGREVRDQILSESYGPDYLQAMEEEEQQMQEDLIYAQNDIHF